MRLRIRLRSSDQDFDGHKYLILVDTTYVKTVQQVENHIRKTLNIDEDRVQLWVDDCIIPSLQSSQILIEQAVYQCYILNSNPLKRKREQHPIKQSKNNNVKKSIPKKIARLPPKIQYQSSGDSSPSVKQSSESEQNSESSESSESSKSIQKYPHKKMKLNLSNADIAKHASQVSTSRLTSRTKKQPIVTQQRISTKHAKPPIQRNSTPPPKGHIVPHSEERNERRNPNDAQKQKIVPRIAIINKKVLDVSSDEDSDKSDNLKPSQTPISKANVPIAVRKQQFRVQNKNSQLTASIKPIIEQETPKRHQQHQTPHTQQSQQWHQISVKILEQTRKTHQRSFLCKNQKILFQTTELDQEKFVPRVSDWKLAEVESVSETNEDIVLITQPKRKKLKLCEFNIVGLKVHSSSISEFQQLAVKSFTDLIVVDSHSNPIKTDDLMQVEPKPSVKVIRQQASLKDLVLTQVNYYFSDGNYNRDNYLISHAALHPELYVNANVILNFPKLKRTNITQEQLMTFLRQELRPNPTYELHPNQNKLRKKGLRIENKSSIVNPIL